MIIVVVVVVVVGMIMNMNDKVLLCWNNSKNCVPPSPVFCCYYSLFVLGGIFLLLIRLRFLISI